MQVTIPHRVHRSFVQAHTEWIFVFSNDHEKHGLEGMAWFFEGEPNAYQVSTCVKKCKNSRYFNDSNPTHWQWVEDEVARIPLDDRPIVVMPKIGLGCSRMKELAPKLYTRMWELLDAIRHKDVQITYT